MRCLRKFSGGAAGSFPWRKRSMYRLVKRGVVTDRRELSGDVKSRVRVYYHLTESGMEYFQEILADYKRSAQGMQNFFAYHTEDDHERN